MGVVYQTSAAQMRRIPRIVQSIVESTPDTTFDRSHFKSFGDSGLIVETAYFVKDQDYKKFMDRQEQINLAVMEAFEREGIEFAYPTQTLFVSHAAKPSPELVKN